MIAEGLLKAGATVAITSRKADICEAAAAEMASLGQCIALPAGSAFDPARVINIGSVAGMRTEKLHAYSYAASKAAVHMMSRDLAGDLADRNITVNAVIPGFFPTKMTAHMRDEDTVDPALLAHIPMKRMGTPEDIAGIVIFLCSRAGAYVTGAQLPVDGGIVGCS